MAAVGAAAELLSIPALTASGSYTSKRQELVTDPTGEPRLSLSLVPEVLVSRTVSSLRKATPMPFAERVRAIAAAVELFATQTVAGMTPEQHATTVSRITGSPITFARGGLQRFIDAGRSVERTIAAAAPAGVSPDPSDPQLRDGGALWVRRGATLAMHAAGNASAIHASWLPPLALGFRVAVRPSRREPLTPYRLVTALRQCGFGEDQIAVLPTDYAGADEMLRSADLGLVYGGEDIVAKYGNNPRISVQGPGRSKIVIGSDVDWREHLDVIVASISAGGGANCMNASAVLIDGDASALAEAIAARLAELPALPQLDEHAVLPVRAASLAHATESHVLGVAQGARIWLGADGIAHEFGDGSATVMPAVFELASAGDERVQLEFPFPCVWVAPWSYQQHGTRPLRDSLALTALTHDQALIDELLEEPSIASVKTGDIPTGWSAPHLPHDDYMLSFFMRAKAVRTTATSTDKPRREW